MDRPYPDDHPWMTLCADTDRMWIVSDKTLIGLGINIKLIGKGLRFVGGSNINLRTSGVEMQSSCLATSNIWIDHVTISLLGRQHNSFGQGPSDLVTVSNSRHHLQ
ncbi:hypothetical protein DFH09DRAFT_1341704 [Mycena vulgaris]|nr:hypothetical protein DFH09DRAFT_1341704 [Mycena vulgaris]